jgi:hypothetical protein
MIQSGLANYSLVATAANPAGWLGLDIQFGEIPCGTCSRDHTS